MVFFVGEGFRPPGLDVLLHMPGRDYLLEDTEVRLLLEGVLQWYGFDFRDYAPEILKRRLWERIDAEGLFPLTALQDATANYVKAGGARAFSEYYTVQDDRVVMDAALRESIVFAEHHLATDGSFNEFQVIMCRNAMGLFNEWLQERVH